MDFKSAFQLIRNIHDQSGDRQTWDGYGYDEGKRAIETFDSFEEWLSALNTRTDISQDLKWELECMDASFAVLFALTKERP